MANITIHCCSNRHMPARDLAALLAAAAVALGTVGCSSSTAPNAGSLTVTITAPNGVTPQVTVSGPGGYNKVLGATATLNGLVTGSYVVTAAPVTIAAPIVGTVNTATVSGSPATVASGAVATATAAYAPRAGSGGLWVVNYMGSPTAQYTAGQLGSTTSAPPATALGTGPANSGVAFDANGNLWVTLATNNSVAEYAASQLNGGGTPAPAVTLSASSGSLSSPGGLAFDASGNLWIANQTDSTVVEFTSSQLASSGSPTPTVTLRAAGGSLNQPFGLAFDGSGNLWVANFGDSTVVEFTPNQLMTGTPTPAVTISADSGSLGGPVGLAFDRSGNLWVGNAGLSTNTVVEFTPSQLAVTGRPAPMVTLSTNHFSLSLPVALAFDASGNLWVANLFFRPSVVEFAANQLAASGSPLPSVTLSGSSLVQPLGLAFDPHAAGLPLKP